MKLKTCISPSGKFMYGIHKPSYSVENLRENEYHLDLGALSDNTTVKNDINFPENSVEEKNADWIFEIPNPFPFRGTTYIARRWAENKAGNPEQIKLPPLPQVSFSKTMDKQVKPGSTSGELIKELPEPLQLALATSSTDSVDLIELAKLSCRFKFAMDGKPVGLKFKKDNKGNSKADISDFPLFEALANNEYLPDEYKEVMVLRPGVQGGSEIVGEWLDRDNESHIFEYLRRNSYIPWGHYAANVANDSVRYRLKDLSFLDMRGLRHLYYQRTYVRLINDLNLPQNFSRKTIDEKGLEGLRTDVNNALSEPGKKISFDRTLWGWNFGFDFAPSHYRLHASHQQIHHQFAMIPTLVSSWYSGTTDSMKIGDFNSYACGDLIESFIQDYKKETGVCFFEAYLKAIKNNKRMDDRHDANHQLVVHEDENIIVFVPKAQTSQWELQMMTKKPVGNILEADSQTRFSLDRGMYYAVRVLAAMGAKMITSIEFSKRFNQLETDQRLLYSFLPKLPESPGAFSEAQLRWINGHYPEDFATACRKQLPCIAALLEK